MRGLENEWLSSKFWLAIVSLVLIGEVRLVQ